MRFYAGKVSVDCLMLWALKKILIVNRIMTDNYGSWGLCHLASLLFGNGLIPSTDIGMFWVLAIIPMSTKEILNEQLLYITMAT